MFRRMSLFVSIVALSLFTVNAATISGVVKENDSTGAAISGATVTLTPIGGGTARLDTTDATGAFSFASVNGTAAAPVTYRISAAKTGYRVMLGSTVQVNNATGTFTVNLYLVPTTTTGVRTISGIVYDSTAGSALAALAGARIILSTRNGIGAGTPIDTVTSGANGSYTFDSVAVGTYALTVSATSFAPQTANVNVVNANVSQNFKLLHIQTASITGAVTDSAAGTPVVGAKIYLLTRTGIGGGTIIDSTVTATGGTYTLSNVPSSVAGINYTVRASMTDYVTSNTNITVTGTAAQTVNIKLVKILMASISGTVTDSSASGVAPVAGAQITLRSGLTVVDSVVTGSAGTYSFANVPSGVSYTIRAVATGYVTSNTNLTITGTSAQTVNIRLVKTPSGNLFVLVKASADSSVINGASVSATIGATVLSASTGSNGLASFLDAATGNYSITVSAANFTPLSSTTALVANRNDTVKVYLVAAAAGTKTLTGVVKDSSTSAALAHVAVVLTIQGAGIGGTVLTLVDSTDASGNYSFTGIPTTRNTGRIVATLAGYLTFTNTAVSIGAANTADNTIYNFVMKKAPSGVLPGANLASRTPDFSLASKGTLRLSNIVQAGSIKVFGLDGRLLYQSAVNAGSTSLALPSSIAKSGNAFIVSLSQKNAVYRKQILMP